MADSPELPGSHRWKLVEVPGSNRLDLPPEFFKFFRELVGYIRQIQGNTDDLAEIETRLDALESAAAQGAITGQASVQAIQQEAATIVRLVGDVPIPGVSRFYGTNAGGARGWHQRLLATLADVDLTGLADGDALVWNATSERFVPGQMSGGGVLPVVTGEISGGQPVFVYGPDGSLVYGPI